MAELFLDAFLLGALFNATPGVVFAESLRRGIEGGFGPAFAVQVGSLAGDLVWAVLGLLGAAALFALPRAGTPLALAGAALLLWMAWRAARDGLTPMPERRQPPGPVVDRPALAAGAALSLSNPNNMTYWAALGGTISAMGVADPGRAAFAVFLAGFMLSSALWCVFCAWAIAGARRFVGPVAWAAIHLGCAAGLGAFGALVAWRALAAAAG